MEGPIEAIDASGSEERKLPANVEEASGEGSRGREAAGNSPAQSASGSAPSTDDYVSASGSALSTDDYVSASGSALSTDDYVSTCRESIKHGVACSFYPFIMLVVG